MLNFQPSALIVAGITDTLGVCARVPDTGSVTPRADSAFAAANEAQNLSHVHQQLLTAARQAFPSAPIHPEAAAHRHTAAATMRRLAGGLLLLLHAASALTMARAAGAIPPTVYRGINTMLSIAVTSRYHR